MGAQTLRTKLWLCHGFTILGYPVESGSPLAFRGGSVNRLVAPRGAAKRDRTAA